MEKKKFIELIVKYLNSSITAAELMELDNALKDSRNDELFKSYIRSNYLTDLAYKSFDSVEGKKQIILGIRKMKLKETSPKIILLNKKNISRLAIAA